MLRSLQRTSVKVRVYSIALIAGLGLCAVLVLSLMQFRQSMFENAFAATRQQVETATSLLAHFQAQEQAGLLSRAQAQEQAKSAIRALRYDTQDYFFITDFHARVIVHPIKPELDGTDVSGVKDPNGIPLFKVLSEEAARHGTATLAYSWPKPGNADPQPKISYSQSFAPWQWVVGSGVYVDDVNSAVEAMALKLGLVGLAAAFVTIGCGIAVARGIVHVVGGITLRATALAQGDVVSDVPFITFPNEAGDLARAIETCRESAVVKARLESEAAVQKQREDEKLRRIERAYEEAGAGQTAVVTAMANGLAQLADGNLAYRLSQTFPGEYEKLGIDFNRALEKMEQAMTSIVAVTHSVDESSDQMAQASDDLSRRTEQQAASLEETAAALNVIASTVKDMAANAGETATVAVAAKTAADVSGTVVEQAVGAMGKIRQSSQEITNIIGVIDEIAFQTNLLALNAGVEAARAGDAGRGFAVVASEVRALAQRSAEAAKEIKTLISASAVQVETGVSLVGKTGLALKDITAKVSEMDHLIRQISTSSREQASGLAEINTAITQMDQLVQQNAAMVEESTAAAHALKAESQDLSAMVGRFRLRAAA